MTKAPLLGGPDRRFTLLLLALLVLALAAPGASDAAPPADAGTAITPGLQASPPRAGQIAPPATQTFASIGWSTQVVTGGSSTVDLYFPGPGHVALGPANILTLVFSPSPLLDARASNLSVRMNDVEVAGLLLIGRGSPRVVTVRIPARVLIADGYNHLRLVFNLLNRVKHTCDANDPALNVTLFGNSALRYDVRGPAPETFVPDLARLPAPFVTIGGSVSDQFTVGLPQTPTAGELTAAGTILARLGQDMPTLPPTITVVLAASLPQRGQQTDTLLVGTPRDNPAMAQLSYPRPLHLRAGRWSDARGHALPPEEGVIALAMNPWDTQRTVLVVSGNGPQGIARAATVLGSAALRGRLRGAFALLPRAPQLPLQRPVAAAVVTLADRGYGQVTPDGVGEHDIRYVFDLPRPPSGPGLFTMIFGHSASVAGTFASVRVDLNDRPLAGRQLLGTDPPRVSWAIPLPVNVLRTGANVLTVRFYLDAPRVRCAPPPVGTVWATIDPDSAISVPLANGPLVPDLGTLPYPLVRNGDTSGTVLVLPAGAEREHDALNLAVLLGSQTRVDAPQLTVLSADQATAPDLRGHPVLLDGLPADNRYIAQLLPKLPQQALELARQSGPYGLLGALISPWDPQQVVVMVSGSTPALLPQARRALLAGDLSGPIVLVDAQGHLQPFTTQTPQPALPAPLAPVPPAPPSGPLRSFASIGWTTHALVGGNITEDLYFPGPGPFVVGSNSTLTLIYSRSPFLDPHTSTLSVVVNEVDVRSVLIQGGLGDPATLVVRIPGGLLINRGYNHIQLIMSLRNRLTPVCGIKDPTLNMTFYDASTLHYDVRGPLAQQAVADLAQMPAPFILGGDPLPAQIAVGLPDRPSATELTAAGGILARLGEDAPTIPPTITVLLAAGLPQLASRPNALLIGTPAGNPAIAQIAYTAPLTLTGGLWRDAQGRPLPADEGVIAEAANPADGQQTLLVVSGNGQQGIQRAAAVLASAALRRQLHGAFALIPSGLTLAAPQSRPRVNAALGYVADTLAALGYAQQTPEGPGEHDIGYTFDLPQAPTGSGTFTLIYGHSATVEPLLSSVRLDLNNRPLTSKKLAPDDPSRVLWQVTLPLDLLHAGTNVLIVRFFLNSPGADCALPPPGSLWATVDTASTLGVPVQKGLAVPDLSALPYPLVHDGDPQGTVLVVPAGAQQDALNMAVLLGTQARVDAPQITVLSADQATPADLRGHPVLLDGLPGANRYTAQLLPRLPQAALALARQTGAYGVVGALVSPWDGQQQVIVATASEPALLPLTRRAVFSGSLGGTIATLDARGHVQSFTTLPPVTAPAGVVPAAGAPAAGAPAAARGGSSTAGRPIIALTLAGAALLLLVLLGAVARRTLIRRSAP